MDIQTLNYRQGQFDKLEHVKGLKSEYGQRLKVINDFGETFWLEVNEKELKAIKNILTDKRKA